MSRLRIDVLKFNSFVNCPKFPIFLVPLCLSLRNRCTAQVKKTADRCILLRIAFQPVSDHEAVTAGLGSGRGDTLRLIKEDGEDRLAFSGLLLRKKLN